MNKNYKRANTDIVAFQYQSGLIRKMGTKLLSRACCNRTRGNVFKLKEGRYKKVIFYNECGEILEQDVLRSDRCPIPGNIPGQVGWGSEKLDLVEDVTAHCKGFRLDHP